VVSIFTAAAMWWVMPKALAMPSMAQLEDANRRLQHEIGERERAEGALRDVNAQLEQRVAARTAELEGEVAQRRHAEETLRASEERWRSMFEASAVGIALTDENRRFVAANKAFQKMIGYTEEELSTSAQSRLPTRMTGRRPGKCSTTCCQAGAQVITSKSDTGARTAP
jgi:PAS domain-containing protein